MLMNELQTIRKSQT